MSVCLVKSSKCLSCVVCVCRFSFFGGFWSLRLDLLGPVEVYLVDFSGGSSPSSGGLLVCLLVFHPCL